MILADTSVWINHIQQSNRQLYNLLQEDKIIHHSMITIEVALGSLQNRERIIELLSNLPRADAATELTLLEFIASNDIYSTGLGYVDANLLQCAFNNNLLLWTHDRRLKAQAEKLGCAFHDHSEV